MCTYVPTIQRTAVSTKPAPSPDPGLGPDLESAAAGPAAAGAPLGHRAQRQQKVFKTEDDEMTDDKLDDLLGGVKRLHHVADDMNTELDRQAVIIDSIDDRLDSVNAKVVGQTKQMQRIS